MSKETYTPSSIFNSRVRGKKLEFNENDKSSITKALSLIWIKTNKMVNSCLFERNKVTLSCKGSRIYFDLVEDLSLDNPVENTV